MNNTNNKLKIITTTPTKPPRIIVYGDHKVGKSTFGKGCPKPIFIQTEDGLESLGVEAFPKCDTFEDLQAQLEHVRDNDLGYKTLVLDSLDWAEKLIWEKICRDNGWAQIGDGPFGKGYKLALVYWNIVIDLLDEINLNCKMLILLIAHAKIVKFQDPSAEDYDRYSLDLHDKSSKLLCEYVDIIGFAANQVAVIENKEGFGKSFKAKSTGRRELNLNMKASFEAGNRYGLPDKLPLEWAELERGIKSYFGAQRKGNLTDVVEAREAQKQQQQKEEKE